MQAATATRVAIRETAVRRRVGPEWARRALRSRLAVPAIIVLLGVLLCAVAANVVAPYDPFFQDYASVLEPPSPAHLMGTDDIGRDVLSRIIYGSRISVSVGLVAVALASDPQRGAGEEAEEDGAEDGFAGGDASAQDAAAQGVEEPVRVGPGP